MLLLEESKLRRKKVKKRKEKCASDARNCIMCSDCQKLDYESRRKLCRFSAYANSFQGRRVKRRFIDFYSRREKKSLYFLK